MPNNYPKLHNAMWPGIVGKGAPDSEPIIPLDTLLELTANAEADGQKFDGVDLFVVAPHFDIDSDLDAVKRMTDHIAGYGLEVGSFVAPIWGGAGGGSAMGSEDERKRFLDQVRKACEIGRQMRELGIRPTGGIRIDSSASVEHWDKDPKGNSKLIAETFAQGRRHRRRPRRVHRRRGRDLLGRHAFLADDARPARGGRHARASSATRPTWRTRCSTPSATTPRPTASCPRTTTGTTRRRSTPPTSRSRTRCGPGRSTSTSPRTTAPSSAPATTRRPAATAAVDDPNGRLDIVKHAGYWLRDENGDLTKTHAPHLLGRLHASECGDGGAGDLEQGARRHGQGPRRPRLDASDERWPSDLNIGMIGYGFMGRGHSNAFRTAPNFFDLPPPPGPEGRLRPQRGEDQGTSPTAGATRSIETDWRKLIERKDIDLVDICVPNDLHAEIAIAAAKAGKTVHHREAARPHRRRRRADGRRRREGRRPNIVCYNYRRMPAVSLVKQMVDCGQARPHLPLPRQVPAGLDHLARRAAGRRRHLAARRRGGRLRRHRRSPRPLPRHRDLDQRLASQPDRDDRDLRQGAHPRRHRQGAGGRHRRRGGGADPLRQRLARHLRVDPLRPRPQGAPTRWRSTASTARSPGTCTTSTASPGSTIGSRARCAAGPRSSSPTASTPISASGGCRASSSASSIPSCTRWPTSSPRWTPASPPAPTFRDALETNRICDAIIASGKSGAWQTLT